jgi:hypothetical protein
MAPKADAARWRRPGECRIALIAARQPFLRLPLRDHFAEHRENRIRVELHGYRPL